MTPEGHPEKFNIGTPWHTNDAFEAAMKYRSPIEIIQGELETKIENDIMTAVQRYDIRVDKEELIKALQYDRKQYEQGWNDARKAYKRPKGEWETVKGNYFTTGGDAVLICPFCHSEESKHSGGVEFPVHWNFCPYCGAEMLPEEEEQE